MTKLFYAAWLWAAIDVDDPRFARTLAIIASMLSLHWLKVAGDRLRRDLSRG